MLLGVAIFCLFGCSVDELKIQPESINVSNLTHELSICETKNINIENHGVLKIINDEDFIYVTISGIDGYLLSDTKLHIANSVNQFPLNGNDNLPPGQMRYKENFDPAKSEFTFTIPYVGETGDKKVIASNNTFLKNGTYINSWVGTKTLGKNKWAYFDYTIQACGNNTPLCSAGANNSISLTETDAKKLPSWDAVRNLYLNLLEPNVDREGIFNPSIYELIDMFNDPNRSSLLGDYSTVYTITEGDCSDSVILTVQVIAD